MLLIAYLLRLLVANPFWQPYPMIPNVCWLSLSLVAPDTHVQSVVLTLLASFNYAFFSLSVDIIPTLVFKPLF